MAHTIPNTMKLVGVLSIFLILCSVASAGNVVYISSTATHAFGSLDCWSAASCLPPSGPVLGITDDLLLVFGTPTLSSTLRIESTKKLVITANTTIQSNNLHFNLTAGRLELLDLKFTVPGSDTTGFALFEIHSPNVLINNVTHSGLGTRTAFYFKNANAIVKITSLKSGYNPYQVGTAHLDFQYAPDDVNIYDSIFQGGVGLRGPLRVPATPFGNGVLLQGCEFNQMQFAISWESTTNIIAIDNSLFDEAHLQISNNPEIQILSSEFYGLQINAQYTELSTIHFDNSIVYNSTVSTGYHDVHITSSYVEDVTWTMALPGVFEIKDSLVFMDEYIPPPIGITAVFTFTSGVSQILIDGSYISSHNPTFPTFSLPPATVTLDGYVSVDSILLQSTDLTVEGYLDVRKYVNESTTGSSLHIIGTLIAAPEKDQTIYYKVDVTFDDDSLIYVFVISQNTAPLNFKDFTSSSYFIFDVDESALNSTKVDTMWKVIDSLTPITNIFTDYLPQIPDEDYDFGGTVIYTTNSISFNVTAFTCYDECGFGNCVAASTCECAPGWGGRTCTCDALNLPTGSSCNDDGGEIWIYDDDWELEDETDIPEGYEMYVDGNANITGTLTIESWFTVQKELINKGKVVIKSNITTVFDENGNCVPVTRSRVSSESLILGKQSSINLNINLGDGSPIKYNCSLPTAPIAPPPKAPGWKNRLSPSSAPTSSSTKKFSQGNTLRESKSLIKAIRKSSSFMQENKRDSLFRSVPARRSTHSIHSTVPPSLLKNPPATPTVQRNSSALTSSTLKSKRTVNDGAEISVSLTGTAPETPVTLRILSTESTNGDVSIRVTSPPGTCATPKQTPGLLSLVVSRCSKSSGVKWYYWASPVIAVAAIGIIIAVLVVTVKPLRTKILPYRGT